MDYEKKLAEMGIVLNSPKKPVAEYIPAKRVGNLLFVSGQDCRRDGELIYEGKVGKDLTIAEGKEAARQVAINALCVVKDFLGSLDKVKNVVKILGFVNSADGFVEQPFVINGTSELLVEVFGEKGRHSRSAISSNELPFNTPVEVEFIFEVE